MRTTPPASRERAWARLSRQWPLSSAGLALLLLSGAVLAYGRARMDLVLTLAGLFWVALALLGGVLNCFAAWRVHNALRPPAGAQRTTLRLVEGQPAGTRLGIPRARLPLTARPGIAWVQPPADVELVADGSSWSERVVPRERCLVPHVVREFRQEDLLGLWRIRGRIADPLPLQVLPDTGRLTAADLAACLTTGDLLSFPFGPARGDMIDARPYTPSDPARLILWKVYARTRQLLVRTPEQARSPDRQPLVYLVAGPHDDAAAAVVRLIAESRMLGDGARFAADGAPVPTTDADEALDAVCASSAHRDRRGRDLAVTLSHPTVEADDPVVLVVPAEAAAWSPEVLARVAERPDRFLVVAAGDAAPRRPDPGWRGYFVAPDPSGAPSFEQLVGQLDACRRTGVRLVLAERRGGRVTVLAAGDTLGARELASV